MNSYRKHKGISTNSGLYFQNKILQSAKAPASNFLDVTSRAHFNKKEVLGLDWVECNHSKSKSYSLIQNWKYIQNIPVKFTRIVFQMVMIRYEFSDILYCL